MGAVSCNIFWLIYINIDPGFTLVAHFNPESSPYSIHPRCEPELKSTVTYP